MCADKRFDRGRARRQEEALEHSKVEPFILESEGKMSFKRHCRRVTGRHDPPAILLDDPVMRPRAEEHARQRRLKAISTDQGAIAGRGRRFRQAPLVKNDNGS